MCNFCAENDVCILCRSPQTIKTNILRGITKDIYFIITYLSVRCTVKYVHLRNMLGYIDRFLLNPSIQLQPVVLILGHKNYWDDGSSEEDFSSLPHLTHKVQITINVCLQLHIMIDSINTQIIGSKMIKYHKKLAQGKYTACCVCSIFRHVALASTN